MPERRGYLDRLVDVVPARRGRAARVPRQLGWGPTRPALVDDVAAAEPEPQRTRPVTPTAGPPVPAPRPAPADVPEHVPVQRPVRTPLHAVVEPNARADSARHVPSTASDEAARSKAGRQTQEPAQPVSPATRPAQMPGRQATAAGATPAAGASRESVSAMPPMAPVPSAATSAFERLSALSIPVSQPPVAAPPSRAVQTAEAPAQPTAERAGREGRSTAVLPAPRTRHAEQPRVEPQVRIGTIEVTVLPPPPAPAPVAPPPAPVVPSAPAPVARLSRPPASYGFGQG